MTDERRREERPGGRGAQPPPAARPAAAKAAAARYQRNLPHIQFPGRTLYITFATHQRWVLPEEIRGAVLDHCLHDHCRRYALHCAVVMPDHVHLLLTPARDEAGETFGTSEIMNGIKGASAHTVNRMLSRRGRVWTPESFDRMLRSDEQVRAVAEYSCENPVRADLVGTADDWPWLWREWVNGEEHTPR